MTENEQQTIDRLLEENASLRSKYQALVDINANAIKGIKQKEKMMDESYNAFLKSVNEYQEFRRKRTKIDSWQIITLIILSLFNTISGIRYIYKSQQLKAHEQTINSQVRSGQAVPPRQ